MNKIEDLQDPLNWSYEQIRSRCSRLTDRFSDISERGKNNKILVTDQGLAYLKRLKELEDSGYSLKAALKVMEKDRESMEQERVTGETKPAGAGQETVQALQNQIDLLKEQLQKKDQQIAHLQDQVDRLLPAGKEEKQPSASPWQLFKNWLFEK